MCGNEHADIRQDGCVFLFTSPFVFKCVCTLYPLLQVFREESWKHQLREVTRKNKRSKEIKSGEIKDWKRRRQISAKETETSEEISEIYRHRCVVL